MKIAKSSFRLKPKLIPGWVAARCRGMIKTIMGVSHHDDNCKIQFSAKTWKLIPGWLAARLRRMIRTTMGASHHDDNCKIQFSAETWKLRPRWVAARFRRMIKTTMRASHHDDSCKTFDLPSAVFQHRLQVLVFPAWKHH